MTQPCNDDCPAPQDNHSINIIDNILNGNSILSGDILSGNTTVIGDVLSPDIHTGDITLIGGDTNLLSGAILSDLVSVGNVTDVLDVGNITTLATVADLVNVSDVTNSALNAVGNSIIQDTLDAGIGNLLVNALGSGGSVGALGLLSGNEGSALLGADVGSALASLSALNLTDGSSDIHHLDLTDVGAVGVTDFSSLIHGSVDALASEVNLFNVDIPGFDFGHHG